MRLVDCSEQGAGGIDLPLAFARRKKRPGTHVGSWQQCREQGPARGPVSPVHRLLIKEAVYSLLFTLVTRRDAEVSR